MNSYKKYGLLLMIPVLWGIRPAVIHAQSSNGSILVQSNMTVWSLNGLTMVIEGDETRLRTATVSIQKRISPTALFGIEWFRYRLEVVDSTEWIRLNGLGLRFEKHYRGNVFRDSWYLGAVIYIPIWSINTDEPDDFIHWTKKIPLIPGISGGYQVVIGPGILKFGLGVSPTTPVLDLQLGFKF